MWEADTMMHVPEFACPHICQLCLYPVSFPTICLLFLSDSDQHILEYGCSYRMMYVYG